MKGLSRRDRRAMAIGLLVMLGVLGIGRGLPVWRSWVAAARERAWQSETRLTRLRAAVAGHDAMADSLLRARERYLALAPKLLVGNGAATTGAALLAWVSGAAARSNVALGTVQTLPDSLGASQFIRVTVRGEATGDIEGLTGFLEVLERGPTLAVVRELSVDQPEPGAAGDQPEALRLQFRVDGIGLRRVGDEKR